jgi:hypothetical protein
MAQNVNFSIDHSQVPANKEQYQILVRILIYLSHTRSDIVYAAGVLS